MLGPVLRSEDSSITKTWSLSSGALRLGHFDSKEFKMTLKINSFLLQQPKLITIRWIQVWLRFRFRPFYSFVVLCAQILCTWCMSAFFSYFHPHQFCLLLLS